MRGRRTRRTLPAVSSSMTRRQLLIRTGGAGVALAGFGLLSQAATADPAALATVRSATYASLLAAVDALPAYEIPDQDAVASRFAEDYATGDAPFRAYVDATLDALEPVGLDRAGPQLAIDALTLVKRPYVSDEDDSHQILFSV
jgi:hypothetical protein